MFYCDECGAKNQWDGSLHMSHGVCEVCGKEGECNDIPSSELSPPKKAWTHPDYQPEKIHPKTKELKEALEELGWTLNECGCGFYRVHNHHGEPTSFEIRHGVGVLEFEKGPSSRGVFGVKNSEHGNGGAFVLTLEGCTIEVSKDKRGLSIFPAAGDKDVFLSFYNFDKDKPEEKTDVETDA